MKKYFDKSVILNCDCFVADYTEISGSRKGVVISVDPFDDIAFFHLKKMKKEQQIPYLAVNLEEYPDFIKGTQNCECVFSSLKDGKSWILFLETKYCSADNIEKHAYKAFSQMEATMNKLIKLNLVDISRKRVYFAYSVPGHDELSPFGSFTLSQNDVLTALKDSGVHPLPYNTVVIATPEYLFPQPVK